MREFCADIVELRRGGHSGARLKMEQERLELERENTEEEVAVQFECWAEKQEVRDWICQASHSPEERKRRLREIFGREPDPANEPAPVEPDQTESNPIKPKSARKDF